MEVILSKHFNMYFIFLFMIYFINTNSQKIEIKWTEIIRVTKTIPTLQIVPNPLMERKSKIHGQVYKNLEDLKVDYIRYVPWFPYPKLYIPELEALTATTTSWNFTLIDPMIEDFMKTQKGRKVVINYSAIPQWMFKSTKKVSYPESAEVLDWNYLQGTELVDPSLKQISEYFERIVSWYVNGGFTDENGKKHVSGHNYTIDYWEVLNEVDYEHKTTPEQYTNRYDAIVNAIKKVSPKTKFVGLVLNNPIKALHNTTYFQHFLNHSNHKPNTPLDAISYHFYAQANESDTIQTMEVNFFKQANQFLDTVKLIEKIRKSLSPNTITMVNEIGAMNDSTNKTLNNTTHPLPKEFMNLSAALYAYMFAELTKLGIEIVAESQYVGYPKPYVFYPSLTMVDWNTGAPNCRFNVLKLIFDHFGPSDKLINTTIVGSDKIHATGFVTIYNQKKLLLINKSMDKVKVVFSGVAVRTYYVDINTNDLIKTIVINANTLNLDPFAVHAIEF